MCLPYNYTQVYLLVNIFIIVFPFKFIQDKKKKKRKTNKKKKNKDDGPGRNARCVLVYSAEMLLLMGIVLLVSAISEGKRSCPFEVLRGAGHPR